MFLSEWRTVLSNKQFRRVWLSLLVGGAGTAASSVAIVWYLWDDTRSYFLVGASLLAFSISGVACSLLAGVWSDRTQNLKQLVSVSTFAIAATSAMLYVLWEMGSYKPWSVLVILFVRGVAVHLCLLSWRVYVTQLVPEEHLEQAARLDVGASNTARATGPLVVLPLFLLWGGRALFIAGIVGGLLMFLGVLSTKTGHRTEAVSSTQFSKKYWQSFHASLQKIKEVALLGLLAATIARSLWEIAPGISAEQYGADITGFAIFMVGLGTGALTTFAVLGTIGNRIAFKTAAVTYLLAGSCGVLITGISSIGWVGFIGFWILGAAHTIQAMSSNAEAQKRASKHSRGQSLGIYVAAVSLGLTVGPPLLGWLAEIAGIGNVHIVGGIVLGAAGLCMQLTKKQTRYS